jgi:hypothetical protein
VLVDCEGMASTDFLGDFPAQLHASIPLFNAVGCLPPGDFFPSQMEFESRFVDIGDTAQRASIYRGWNLHRRELALAGVPDTARQLLNGSYTTAKQSPGDIDIAVEVPLSHNRDFADLMPDHPIVKLLLGPLMKQAYQCDAYPVYVLPKSDVYYAAVTVRAIEYWTKWFGRTRGGSLKGRLWATTGGLR